jgi:uncharacterized protein YecE (DUF72 family)
MKKGAIHIGTSGWSYKHWKGIYYPDDLASTKWLSYYASQFHVSEINTSFYHLPKPATVKGWMEKVPAKFLFCPKMSRYLTQFKKLNEPEASLLNFFDVFEPMRAKMGPILVQLPPLLAYHYDKTAYFFDVLKRQYAHYQFALEIRHRSWLEEEPIALMKQYNIAFVISHSKDRFPYAEYITASHVYVRFHGPEALYASPYTNEQLQYYSQQFLNWKKAGKQVYAFFNNDVNGHAFRDAQKLIDLVNS